MGMVWGSSLQEVMKEEFGKFGVKAGGPWEDLPQILEYPSPENLEYLEYLESCLGFNM